MVRGEIQQMTDFWLAERPLIRDACVRNPLEGTVLQCPGVQETLDGRSASVGR